MTGEQAPGEPRPRRPRADGVLDTDALRAQNPPRTEPRLRWWLGVAVTVAVVVAAIVAGLVLLQG